MHPYYDPRKLPSGALVVAKELDMPSNPRNPTGKDVPAFTDDMKSAGYIPHGSSLIIIQRPETTVSQKSTRFSMFVEVLAPELGRVWVRACDVEFKK